MNNRIKGREKREDMSNELLDKILLAIERFGVLDRPEPLTVRFYGGEPMLRFDKVKYFVEKAKEKKLRLKYVLFTNGVIGDKEKAKYCKENKINLIRGLVGCKAAQDILRPNTYEKFQEMTKLFDDTKGHRRMTVTPDTVKYVADSIKDIIESGSMGATPMPDYYANWTEKDIQEFEKQLEKVADFYIERSLAGKPFYSYFLSRDLACRYTNKVPMSYCQAGMTLFCVSVTGYFYMCHRFVTEPPDSDCCYGYIDDVLNGTAKGFGEIVTKRHIECIKKWKLDKCQNCIGRFGCEQGCHHVNWKTTGSMSTPPELNCRLHIKMGELVVNKIEPALKHIEDWWAKGNFRPEAKNYLKNKKYKA